MSCIFSIVLTRHSGSVASLKWRGSPAFRMKVINWQVFSLIICSYRTKSDIADSSTTTATRPKTPTTFRTTITISPTTTAMSKASKVFRSISSVFSASGVPQNCLVVSIYLKIPGHHGHPGVVAVSPVGWGLPPEPVLALLPR